MMERQGTDRRPVVVGIDDSNRARAAALWASTEASLRGVDLHLVHSSPPRTAVDVPSPRGSAAPAAQRLLHDVGRACERAAPALVVQTHLEIVPAAPALVQWSHRAQLVVVGHHGASRYTGLLVGSVGTVLGEHARCPVTVVRGTNDAAVPVHSGPVVVALTGGPSDQAVLDFAFAAAERDRCPVIAVRTWWTGLDEDVLTQLFESGGDVDQHLARVRDEVSDTVARVQREHPDIALTVRVVHDRPAPTLLDEAERNRPQLLVIAGQEREATPRSLGPAARTVLCYADCPVAILTPEPQRVAMANRESPARSSGQA